MATTLETVLPTFDGMFLLRDVAADTIADQRPAFRAIRIPGSRAAHRVTAVGPVLIVRCAHQYTRPHVRVETLAGAPTDEAPWHWENRMRLASPTGVVVLDADPVAWPELLRIELGTGPGAYGLAVGHVGRNQVREAARRVSADTLSASVEDTTAAWRSLDGVERYLIRLWPLDPWTPTSRHSSQVFVTT